LSWMGGRETGWKEGGERSPVTGGRLVIPLIVEIPESFMYELSREEAPDWEGEEGALPFLIAPGLLGADPAELVVPGREGTPSLKMGDRGPWF